MALKSHEARRAKKAAILVASQFPALPAQNAEWLDEFRAERLIRVRKQLERLDRMAASETDTKAIKELADACARLQEQERQLAGRPLPGTERPPKRGRRPQDALPTPTTPQPAVFEQQNAPEDQGRLSDSV